MTVAVLGAGKLGEALLTGLLRAGSAPQELVVTTRQPARAEQLQERHGVSVLSNRAAVRSADTLLVCVKPADVAALLAECRPDIPPGALVVSLAAGLTTATLEAQLPAGTPVVRVMTNTPALVGQAMSVMAGGSSATAGHLDRVADLLRPVGRVLTLPETQLDAVTALSGSGPAYVFYLVEAMIDAGVLLGLPRSVASELVIQTALGSAVMLAETGTHPALLREAVSSPGGTTVTGLAELQRHAVPAALLAAVRAARDRSEQLGR